MAIPKDNELFDTLHNQVYNKYFEKFSQKLWDRDYDEELNDTQTNRLKGAFAAAGTRRAGKLLLAYSDGYKIDKIRRELTEALKEDPEFKDKIKNASDAKVVEFTSFIANEYNGTSKKRFKEAKREAELSKVQVADEVFDRTQAAADVKTVKEAGGEVKETGLTPDERAQLAKETRLSEQAALMLTIEELLTKSFKAIPDKGNLLFTDKRYKNLSPIIHSQPSKDARDIAFLQAELAGRATISGPTQPQRSTLHDKTSTGHFSLTNFFTKHQSMDVFFRKLPPQVLSFLVPSIKMYKTFYPAIKGDKFSAKVGSMFGFDWRIPFDDVPISFEDDTSKFVAKSPESVLNGRGSFHSVGIKSFSYQYKGTNPAEINTNIGARLEIFFQNPAELVREIDVSWNEILNEEGDFSNFETPKFSYSDLINQTSLKNKINNDQVFNDKYYRLKIECGYADVNEDILRDVLNSADIVDRAAQDEVINAIRSTKVMLYLSPFKYDINFKEDSTIILTIDYISSMDSVLASSDADLFKISAYSRQLKEISDEFESFLRARDTLKDLSKVREQDTTVEEQKKIVAEFKQKYGSKFSGLETTSDEDVLKELNKIRTAAYNSLYDVLIGKEVLTGFDGKKEDAILPKIYLGNFKPHILGIKTEETLDKNDQRVNIFNDGNQINFVEQFITDEQVLIPASDKEDGGSENDPISDINDKTLDKLDKSSDGKSNHVIKFVYLGDILDVAFDCLNYITPIEESPRVIVGNIPFSIPTDKDSNFNLREINPNLAHIPISLSLFQEFMLTNVVKKKRTTYPILEFMKDILSQLVYPAIGPSILGDKYKINAKIRFSTGYFSFPTIDGNDPITDLPLDQRQFPPIVGKDILNKLKRLRDSNQLHFSSAKSRLQAANYIFIVCSSVFPNYIKGNEEEDIQNGLFHVRMGTETGLVQKVSFKTVSIPYLREMIARREGDGRATSLKQYYNAEIEMFGNDIFRPGDFVYIHPNYMYVSKYTDGTKKSPSSIDLEDKLGIGGYYLVLNVETSISDMVYRTRISCAFQAAKIKGKLVPIHEFKPGVK